MTTPPIGLASPVCFSLRLWLYLVLQQHRLVTCIPALGHPQPKPAIFFFYLLFFFFFPLPVLSYPLGPSDGATRIYGCALKREDKGSRPSKHGRSPAGPGRSHCRSGARRLAAALWLPGEPGGCHCFRRRRSIADPRCNQRSRIVRGSTQLILLEDTSKSGFCFYVA